MCYESLFCPIKPRGVRQFSLCATPPPAKRNNSLAQPTQCRNCLVTALNDTERLKREKDRTFIGGKICNFTENVALLLSTRSNTTVPKYPNAVKLTL